MAHGVAEARSLFDREILRQALVDSFRKLDPRVQVKNPVMFVVSSARSSPSSRPSRIRRLFDWSHHDLARS